MRRIRLLSMSDPASSPHPKEGGTFATLLASLTASSQRTSPSWDDSALAGDVATISYEQALRSHRRVAAAEALPAAESPLGAAQSAPQGLPIAPVKKRKTASITIRLTEAEEAQLHERAAAAQLSVSAYLRSCIFEAEELRTKVKEALARMQVPPLTAAHGDKPPRNWHERFLSRFSHRAKADS